MEKKFYITVNKQTIARNLKHRKTDPPIRVSYGRHGPARRGWAVKVLGPCMVVYKPHDPLPWGARLWIETVADVSVQ